MVFFLYATIILKVFKTTQQKFNYVELKSVLGAI